MSVCLTSIVCLAVTAVAGSTASDGRRTMAEMSALMEEVRTPSMRPRADFAALRLCPAVLGSGSIPTSRGRLVNYSQWRSKVPSFSEPIPNPRFAEQVCSIPDGFDQICRPSGGARTLISGDDR